MEKVITHHFTAYRTCPVALPHFIACLLLLVGIPLALLAAVTACTAAVMLPISLLMGWL